MIGYCYSIGDVLLVMGFCLMIGIGFGIGYCINKDNQDLRD